MLETTHDTMVLNVEGSIPDLSSPVTLRLVSFNINGFKTLNHYHPWNDLSSLSEIFKYLKSDIITFQELKLQKSDINRSISSIPNYHSFITIPREKRGYSGVAVFVKHNPRIKVVKVEEGITGYLNVSSQNNQTYRKIWETYGASGLAIGGYTDNFVDWKEGLKLDSDGRSIIIELNNNLVIISVYCLANSMDTEEEEIKKCLFLNVLFQRVENLQKLGKEVIIMGDINVSPSLIDRDDSMNLGLKSEILKIPENKFEWFEKLNKDKTLEFRALTLSRRIFNDYVFDFNEFDNQKNSDKILFDLGRLKNKNRLKMYTCWNTLKNNRPLNIGSRIDLFLGTKNTCSQVENCDIWPFLYGSDHCPIFCDLKISNFPINDDLVPNIKHFESVNYYGLTVTKSIDSFFKFKPKKTEPEVKEKDEDIKLTPTTLTPSAKRSSIVPGYTSRKKQQGQSTLSELIQKKQKIKAIETLPSSLFVPESDEEEEERQQQQQLQKEEVTNNNLESSTKSAMTVLTFQNLLNNKSLHVVPNCEHNEPCILRTTRKGVNTGRKFWCCSKPTRNETWDHDDNDKSLKVENQNDYSCSFFKWAQK